MAISDFFSGGNTPDYLSGLLDDEQLQKLKSNAQRNAMLQFGLSALSQGGYSQTPVGIGEILGKAGMAGMQGYQQGVQSGIEGIGTRAKLEALQRQRKQQADYDVAARDLYKTIPAQYETRQVAGGGYLPAQQEVMPGQVAPNFNLSQTMAAPTTEQVMTRPEVSGINNAALLKMIETGDPRATAMMGALSNYKDYTTPVKEQLITIPENASLYSQSKGAVVATGLPKVDKISYGSEAEIKAASYGKSFGQLPPNIQKQIEREIANDKLTNASASATKLPPVQKAILEADQKTYESLTQKANAAREVANTTRNINSLLAGNKGGGALKFSAGIQKYLGINSPTVAADTAAQALATVSATQIRAAGSGSTSDLEFSAYVNAFPSLATTAAGRQVMADIAEAQATRNTKLADWSSKALSNGTFSYEGLNEFDKSLGKAVSAKIQSNYQAALKSAGGGGGGKNIHSGKTNQQILDELSGG